jgi:hypothetical protein
LEATVANGGEGESVAYKLGRVVLVPTIESFAITEEPAGSGNFIAKVSGQNLESIEKIGWTPEQGQPVEGLPLPVGDGPTQRLQARVSSPPDPDAQVLVWLRSESTPRVTSLRADAVRLVVISNH